MKIEYEPPGVKNDRFVSDVGPERSKKGCASESAREGIGGCPHKSASANRATRTRTGICKFESRGLHDLRYLKNKWGDQNEL